MGEDVPSQAPSEMRAPVLVRLPPHLVVLFPDAEPRVALQAGSVAEMVAELDRLWPGMRARLCDETPAIRRHVNVFVDGRRARLSTALAPGTDVFIITAISGG